MKIERTTFNPSHCLFDILLISVLLFLLSVSGLNAQAENNLNILYKLVDSSVIHIINSLPSNENSLTIETNLNDGYSVFENIILADFNKGKRTVSISDSSSNLLVNYSIDNARVSYPDIFRNNIFGSFKVQRNILLSGNYSASSNGILKATNTFSFTSLDTIFYDQIENLESPNLYFTKGEKPAEPFFSSFLEPVIALGTAAAIIYLFFSVRSK